MSIAETIKQSYQLSDQVVQAYLNDLSDDELKIRAVAGMNNINWQVGHIIVSEHQIAEMLCPGSMPPLPEGMAEIYDRANVDKDDLPFYTKERLFELKEEQRAGTIAAIDKLSDEELMKPSPEKLKMLGGTIGAIFLMLGSHWTMHAGQWVAVRRLTGKEVKI
ncbi:MAG: hypothetical protein CMJ46_02050 [Planctomyces sp.]|nr:hypothetical protein [Planctomyces sp.]